MSEIFNFVGWPVGVPVYWLGWMNVPLWFGRPTNWMNSWYQLLSEVCDAFRFITHWYMFVCRARQLPSTAVDWSRSYKSVERSSCCVLGEGNQNPQLIVVLLQHLWCSYASRVGVSLRGSLWRQCVTTYCRMPVEYRYTCHDKLSASSQFRWW